MERSMFEGDLINLLRFIWSYLKSVDIESWKLCLDAGSKILWLTVIYTVVIWIKGRLRGW